MGYYKFTDESVVKLNNEINSAKNDLRKKAKDLCDYFGGKAVFSHDLTSFDFIGMHFDDLCDVENSHLWTKPTRSNGFTSRPRSRTVATSKEALKDIKSKFDSADLKRVDTTSIYEAIGTDWGELMFTGILLVGNDKAVYVKTGAKLSDEFEILGSEFDREVELIKNKAKGE